MQVLEDLKIQVVVIMTSNIVGNITPEVREEQSKDRCMWLWILKYRLGKDEV